MATQGYVQLPTDVANSGKKEDHVVISTSGNYREVVTIGGPSVDDSYAPVDSTSGLKVNLGADNDITVADGSDVNAGTTTDVAVTGDNSGTLSAKLRGLNKILANVWDSVNSRLNVYIQNATLAVTQSGTWNITNVSGTVSLPTGASTAAKQPALGTAGTASADVITVQGITSMTALKVDGSAVTQPVSQATAANLNATVVNPALTDIGAGEYETVAASQTAQVLGTTGAVGDFLAGLLVTPATTSPGNVIILDNATSITVFTGGASSVTNLVPFFIPLGIKSVSGAWKVTTGANVSCIGVGNFT